MDRQVQFNRPVTLSDPAGKDPAQTFGKGTHPVPEALTKGWFFAALVKDGHAIVLREEPPAQPAATTKNPPASPDGGASTSGDEADQQPAAGAAPDGNNGKQSKKR